MLVSKQFLQACQISKESDGVRGKNVHKSYDLTWNDPVVKQKLGDNIVTVTNNVLQTFLKIFAVVKSLPCFPIIADTGTLIKNFRITKGTFLPEFCL